MATYIRSTAAILAERIREPRKFIQVLIGPRQTGKTTALKHALEEAALPFHYASASLDSSSRDWIRAQWHQGRSLANREGGRAVLAIDEVQMVAEWSSVVKELWDEDSWNDLDLTVVLSGSSSLLLKKGLAEALTGRFELIRSPQWSLTECRDAFGYTLDDFLMLGGYPGAAALRDDEDRWLRYMNDSVIEPSIANDAIALEDVRKPALMRRLFYVGAPYSAQEISYRKLLGQLDDAGNTTTLAHYLTLLDNVGLMGALQKYDAKLIRQRSSSPRLMVHDTSLMSATYGQYRPFLLTDPQRAGHLVETAVGAHLIARSKQEGFEVFWWRDGSAEVDFVLAKGSDVIAIEVKSGRVKGTGGLVEFVNRFPTAETLIVGSAGCPLEDFLEGKVSLF